jgi:hypothetical protein
LEKPSLERKEESGPLLEEPEVLKLPEMALLDSVTFSLALNAPRPNEAPA